VEDASKRSTATLTVKSFIGEITRSRVQRLKSGWALLSTGHVELEILSPCLDFFRKEPTFRMRLKTLSTRATVPSLYLLHHRLDMPTLSTF
jgi:hypothetical protein